MKLLKRKSRDPSILERELELMREDDLARKNDLLVRLCDTRIEYVFRATLNISSYAKRRNPSLLNSLVISVETISILPLAMLFHSYKSQSKDSQTGKYLLRYFE